MSEKKRVLILCTGNSARSQMAEGLLRHYGGDKFDVESAGTIKTYVRPQGIEVMRELGIDISNHRSQSLDEFLNERFDYVITVCDDASRRCPIFPGNVTRIHWSIDDPAFVGATDEERLAAFRRARDELKKRLDDFINEV